MATTFKTPGVHVQEISVFPPSVAEVDTAVPAFIGYTAKAQKVTANDLSLKPTKIYSFTEFEQYYGRPSAEEITATVTARADGGLDAAVAVPTVSYLLHHAIKMYFDNGGGKCYIVSVGTYAAPAAIESADLVKGLDAVAAEDEPTLLVVPEAVKLTEIKYAELCKAMLAQCGKLGDRFAILDVFGGDAKYESLDFATKRGNFGTGNLRYGAAYYPFVKSAINFYVKDDETNVTVKRAGKDDVKLDALKSADTAAYNAVKLALRDHFINLPPSGAVAGVYAATDAARGVWKSPANVSLNNVVEPLARISDDQHGELNVDPTTGVSINAIRAFAGKGTLVWGARTLAGNDLEWRYISVRRFFNMVEESVKKSTAFAVFEPNDANTWVKVRGMIENYLTQKWREGALAGATTKDAFFVRCGIGVTMNSQDVLEGRMNVEIGMAVVRPAEFIILKFSHKLQTS